MVEEHRIRAEAVAVRDGGLYTRENVGMSSESRVRIPATEYLRFPEEGSSAQGQSGPKPRTKVVGDGQLVQIPAPGIIRTVGTQERIRTRESKDRDKRS